MTSEPNAATPPGGIRGTIGYGRVNAAVAGPEAGVQGSVGRMPPNDFEIGEDVAKREFGSPKSDNYVTTGIRCICLRRLPVDEFGIETEVTKTGQALILWLIRQPRCLEQKSHKWPCCVIVARVPSRWQGWRSSHDFCSGISVSSPDDCGVLTGDGPITPRKKSQSSFLATQVWAAAQPTS